MHQKYEIVNFNTNMPIHCTLQKLGELTPHLHDFFELVMILSGSCRATVADQVYILNEDDVIAFNCHTTHALRGNDCVLISVQFDQTLFENTLPNPFRPEFDCNSSLQGNLPAFDAIRREIALLVKNNADQKSGYELRNWSIVYALMDILFNHFRVDSSPAKSKKLHRYANRMATINQIINSHFQDSFTLSDLAESVHLSAPYLSKFFEQHYGMTFLNYLTEIRLNYAVNELQKTEHTIEQISSDSGFPNSHAFVQAFRKRYGQLPSVYRRKNRTEEKAAEYSLQPQQHDYIAGLKKYLDSAQEERLPEQTFSCGIACDAAAEGIPVSHNWKRIMPGGSAVDLLFSENQKLVRRAVSEIGFEYISFHGILSDEMRLCSRSKDGSVCCSFLYVDKLLDFLRDTGVKPVIELGFMPEAIAKNPQKKFLGYCTSEPRSLVEWNSLVEQFLRHLLERYGRNTVRSWLFIPWSMPDTPEDLFGFSSTELFYEFYRQTWTTIKACDQNLRIGTPATYYLLGQRPWYADFLIWCSEHKCMPEFLNFHYYDTVQASSTAAKDLFGFAGSMILGESPDGLSEFVHQVTRGNPEKLPVYLTEWNNSPSQQDWLNDTCYKSCYITKGILENMDRLESFCYWSLTDWMGEGALPSELFFGGLGLFTHNGIAKPGYHALRLLSRLGDTCLGKGPGWYITRSETSWQIMLYNYVHFSRLYALGERFDMTFTDRYTPFSPEKLMDASLVLRNLPDGEYLVREIIVNRKHGSAFDLWTSMGALEPDEEELQNLMLRSQPGMNKYKITAQNHTLELSALLEMLEIRLITIEPV